MWNRLLNEGFTSILVVKVVMNTLFQIETDRVMLTWSKARGKEPVPILGNKTTVGRLVIQKRRNGLQFGKEEYVAILRTRSSVHNIQNRSSGR